MTPPGIRLITCAGCGLPAVTSPCAACRRTTGRPPPRADARCCDWPGCTSPRVLGGLRCPDHRGPLEHDDHDPNGATNP